MSNRRRRRRRCRRFRAYIFTKQLKVWFLVTTRVIRYVCICCLIIYVNDIPNRNKYNNAKTEKVHRKSGVISNCCYSLRAPCSFEFSLTFAQRTACYLPVLFVSYFSCANIFSLSRISSLISFRYSILRTRKAVVSCRRETLYRVTDVLFLPSV